jgi:LIVCS family branched-chain amino acid:cation transporter
MSKTKEAFILGFAIFAAFFGAGNLIIPPLVGFKSGVDWWLVGLGFLASTVIIPLLALLGHARLQGTMMDFGKKVSARFSLVFSVCVYVIAVVLACPRTAAVTHEMAIQPYFNTSSFLTSGLYFSLAFIFAVNRGNVMDILGKYLTPVIGIILLAIIGIGIFGPAEHMLSGRYDTPLINGFLEGYQTYDALAGLLMGGVAVITIKNSKKDMSVKEIKMMVARSGLIAMLGLVIIYIGLIFVGAKYNGQYDPSISHTDLLSGLTSKTLGQIGTSFLAVLVALACFTTAVGIIVGTADFFKGLFNDSKKAYVITAALCSLSGIIMGQFEVKFIIDLAVYALMFIYPMAIVLILLNLMPEKFAGKTIFRTVVGTAFFFSIPDFLKFMIPAENLEIIYKIIPFSENGLGWVLPSVLVFLIVNTAILSKSNGPDKVPFNEK